MSKQRTFIEATPEEITTKILSGIKPILQDLQNQSRAPEPFIGVPEAAKIFRVSQQNIRKKCSDKMIPHYQKYEKSPIRFKASELYDWISSGRIKTSEEVKKDTLDLMKTLKK